MRVDTTGSSDPLPWLSEPLEGPKGIEGPSGRSRPSVDVPVAVATLPASGIVAAMFDLPVPISVTVAAAWVTLVGGAASAVWLWTRTPEPEFTNNTES